MLLRRGSTRHVDSEAQALAEALQDPRVLIRETDMQRSLMMRSDFIFEALIKVGWPVYRHTALGNIQAARGRLDVTTSNEGLIYTWLL